MRFPPRDCARPGGDRQSADEPAVSASGRQTADCQTADTAIELGRTLARRSRLWCGGLLQRSAESLTRRPNGKACRPSSHLSRSLVAPTPPARPTALSRPSQSECTAQTETPPWSPWLPALGHCPLKRGMDAPDAYGRQLRTALTGRVSWLGG